MNFFMVGFHSKKNIWTEENASMSILTFDQPLNSPPLPSGVSEEEKVIAVSEEY